jgi:hypothetical protein
VLNIIKALYVKSCVTVNEKKSLYSLHILLVMTQKADILQNREKMFVKSLTREESPPVGSLDSLLTIKMIIPLRSNQLNS